MPPRYYYGRKVLLITSALLVIAAYVNGFAIIDVVSSLNDTLMLLIAILIAFGLGIGIIKLAGFIFDTEDGLWHASLVGYIFIVLMLTVAAALINLTNTFLSPSLKLIMKPEQTQFLVPAFAILWIVLINCFVASAAGSSRCVSSRDHQPKHTHIPTISSTSQNKTGGSSSGSTAGNTTSRVYKKTGLLKQQ